MTNAKAMHLRDGTEIEDPIPPETRDKVQETIEDIKEAQRVEELKEQIKERIEERKEEEQQAVVEQSSAAAASKPPTIEGHPLIMVLAFVAILIVVFGGITLAVKWMLWLIRVIVTVTSEAWHEGKNR